MKKTNFYSLRALGLAALFLTFSLIGVFSTTAFADNTPNSFQVLPPLDYFNRDTNNKPQTCGTGSSTGGTLLWGGPSSGSAISCSSSPNFYVDPLSGTGYQPGKTSLNDGLYINGAGAYLGDKDSTVTWAYLPSQANGECPGGGNVGADVSGGLHCCPYGRVVTAASLHTVTCGTLQ